MRLWYENPAEDWNSALPLGNGKLGAMVFGRPLKERIQLNEDSVWSGDFRDRVNPDASGQRFPGLFQLGGHLSRNRADGYPCDVIKKIKLRNLFVTYELGHQK